MLVIKSQSDVITLISPTLSTDKLVLTCYNVYLQVCQHKNSVNLPGPSVSDDAELLPRPNLSDDAELLPRPYLSEDAEL